MDAPTTSVLPYALWPLLTLAMVALWLAAMADISSHRSRGTFTNAGLVCMAAAVSVAAIMAVAGIGTVFAGQQSRTTSGAASDRVQAAGQGEPTGRTYLFSFGLEHVSNAGARE